MIKVVLIYPYLFDNTFLFLPMDQIGKMLMKEDIIIEKEVSEVVEESIELMEMDKIREIKKDLIGDTLKVFYTKEYTYKMLLLDTKEPDKDKYNLLASILHSEGQKIYYNIVIVKMDKENNYINISKEEVIQLIEKRRIHTGVRLSKKVEEVSMDNNWNIIELGESIREYKKKIINVNGYNLIILSENGNYELEEYDNKYIFAFLDKYKKVLCDFTKEEYYKILNNNQEEIEIDNPNFHS